MGATIIVTGAGGPAGVNVIRALAERARVVAVDADPSAVGLRLAEVGEVVPRADDATFVDRLCDLALRTGAQALVPTVAEELGRLARAAPALAEVGVHTWLPDEAAAERCVDKWAFAEALVGTGVAVPATALGEVDGVPGPWILKPRFGRGSRDVWVVDDADELAWLLPRVPEPLVQTRLTGREFTVDALVDRDGTLAGAVPRWRSETKAGISTKGTTFASETVVEATGELLTALGLTGPACAQGFVADDGSVTFIEVNPRFSGGLALAQAAGADLVGEYVRGVMGDTVRPDHLTFRPGVTMLRHFAEVFEG